MLHLGLGKESQFHSHSVLIRSSVTESEEAEKLGDWEFTNVHLHYITLHSVFIWYACLHEEIVDTLLYPEK